MDTFWVEYHFKVLDSQMILGWDVVFVTSVDKAKLDSGSQLMSGDPRWAKGQFQEDPCLD